MEIYNQLLRQIDRFVSKFYLNIALRGLLLFCSFLLFTTLLFLGIEYFLRLGTTMRALLFFSFIGLNSISLISFIIIPLLKRFRILSTISQDEAAKRIGDYFPDVGDKLLNTLQLNRQSGTNLSNQKFLVSVVEQRVNRLKVYQFDQAIRWKENFKYLKYLAPLFLLFFGIAVINPKILSESSERIMNYNNNYIPPAPFSFALVSDSLTVVEGEKFKLEVELSGSEFPSQVELITDESSYFLRKYGKKDFYYEFPKVKNGFKFHFSANGHRSKDYFLKVIPKPHFKQTVLKVVPPTYTNISPQTYNNLRDIVIPEGSCVDWNFNAVNVDLLNLAFKDTVLKTNNNFNRSNFSFCFRQNAPYHVVIGNDKIKNNDSLYYAIDVIKDAHPQISMDYEVDSTNRFQYFFSGKASDDYGLRVLKFNYLIKDQDGKTVTSESLTISQKRSGNSSRYFHSFDFSNIDLLSGQTIDFYFSIRDNDQINGSKTSTTQHLYIQLPTEDELEDLDYESTKNASSSMEDAMKNFKKFNSEMNDFKNDMLQKKSPDWEDLERFKELKKKRNELENQLKDLKNNLDQNEELLEKLNKEKENDLMKEKINELMEDLLDDEMKELLDELEELLKKNENPQDKLEEMNEKNEDIEKDLERTMELLKHLEMEKMLDQLEKKLEKLSKEQKELSEKNEKKENQDQLKKEQEKIKEKFDEIKEDLDELEKKNDELKDPKDMPSTEEDQEEIDESLNKAQEELDKKNNKKSKEQQKGASEQMKKLSQKMGNMKMQMQQQQQQEDMEALRLLLENLLSLSIDQEALMKDFKSAQPGSLNYNELTRKQKKIIDNTQLVDDSLTALAQRNPMLSTFINAELNELKRNLQSSLTNIVANGSQFSNNRQFSSEFTNNQQYAMTNYNNLALMLSEALDQMQQQMASQKPGSAMCNNPGGSNPKPGMSMQQMKEMLKKQLEKMKEGKDGKKGDGKDGEKGDKPIKLPGGEDGKGGMSAKEKAELAKQQAKMQESLKEMKEKAGKELGRQLQELIDDLEKSQEDIVNNKMNSEWHKRQQDILTRLLESEKAMRERKFDDKRESKTGKNEKNSNQNEYLEYKRRKEKELELLRSLPPELKIYYRNKASEYFNKVMD